MEDESTQILSIQENDDDEETFFAELAEVPIDPPAKRDTCSSCGRPVSVGLCRFFPKERIPIDSCVYIIQHPNEEKRLLRTVPILTSCLPPGKCQVIKGKRFSEKSYPELAKLCSSPNTIVLFPGPDAIDINELPVPPPSTNGHSQGYNILVMDGTWHQATSIFKANAMFQIPQQVQFTNSGSSEYTIRTQPLDSTVCTVESAAIALSVLERNPEIREILAKPLRAMCQFQMNHGAVVHHSKEYLKAHPELPQYKSWLPRKNEPSHDKS
ncbi:DTW domain-containing protein 2 [Strongylocentrotus purpuratus]|uniref:tRNA-uridine aminocarboxypropyltransferase n=1 Tax=Strongylocentrotus purpuratus TaxID=7668 RepID=A0A7M7TH70_STRPU|nr:DTW domain-containing protein 2 [Strongylocentrotus purpuratus]